MDTMTRKALTRFNQGHIFDTQRIIGSNNNYVSVVDGAIMSNGSVTLNMALRPDAACWWEVYLMVGIVAKMDAAYHSGEVYFILSPADAGGSSRARATFTQHSGVNTYVWREIKKMWQLKANTNYQCGVYFACDGGSWQYHQGPTYLRMEGVAWYP